MVNLQWWINLQNEVYQIINIYTSQWWQNNEEGLKGAYLLNYINSLVNDVRAVLENREASTRIHLKE